MKDPRDHKRSHAIARARGEERVSLRVRVLAYGVRLGEAWPAAEAADREREVAVTGLDALIRA